jgi:hypothetical protein
MTTGSLAICCAAPAARGDRALAERLAAVAERLGSRTSTMRLHASGARSLGHGPIWYTRELRRSAARATTRGPTA